MIDSKERQAPPELNPRAEAAAWLARLHGPHRSAQVERGLQRWLQADPEHARAFELLNEQLEVVERLKTRQLPAHWRSTPARARVAWGVVSGIAAALAIVAIGTFAYLSYAGVGTAVGEQRSLTLADGTRVYLNTSTRVRVDYSSEYRRIELIKGEALFEVAKQPDRPFIVAAGDRRITALGTTFLVHREEQDVSVLLVEGRVEVAADVGNRDGNPAPDHAVLAPGERLTVGVHSPPQLDRPAFDKVIAWRQGLVALEDVPLSQAVAEMNRYSTRKLIIERPEAYGAPVGGFFRVGDSESFARAVASTYGLEVVARRDELILSGVPRKSQ